MRKLPATAAEDLLEIIMRCYERLSAVLTSNVDDCGKLLGDTAMLDRMHHAHLLTCESPSWNDSPVLTRRRLAGFDLSPMLSHPPDIVVLL